MWHVGVRTRTIEPGSAESPPSNSGSGSDSPEMAEARRCSWFSRFMGQTSSDTSEPDTGATGKTCLGGFLADVFNGVSQVCLFTNPVAGVLFLAAVIVGQPRTASILCLVGGLSATCCSRCFSLDSAARKDGTLGYNGVLVGCALATFMDEFWWSIPVTIVAAGISSPVVAALLKIIKPQFTLAFNFVVLSTLVLKNLTSIPGNSSHSRPSLFEITWTSVLPEFTAIEFMEAVLNGVAQIYFVSSPLSGILILVGICFAHPFSSFSTLLGSLLSTLVAARCGADRPRLENGIWAYNACLISLWMSFHFRPLGYLPAFFIVCLGALATTAAYAAMDGIVEVTHGVAPSCFTLPFNTVGLLSVALQKTIMYIHFRTKKAPPVEDEEDFSI